jgi:Ni,Fe-hydrogenase III component G
MNAYPINNPFSITKATDFSDSEINEYWVNVNNGHNILNPNELLPKYILGGKGCGKTHLLRYFSYPLQKIRKNSISAIINDDKYIGIYSVLDGITSSKFKGKGVDEEQWKSAFEYYFELYLCDILLNITKDIFAENISENYSEADFVKDISAKFYENIIVEEEIQTIEAFLNELSIIRKKIDIEIVNAAFNRKLDITAMKVLFSPGDLIFGIPALLNKNISSLKYVKFIYILDEYEKLFEWQKVFVNTLVWEKKQPCTFWIGARKYGYTTTQTKTEEHIKPGSEFQPILLDEIFQGNDDLYKNFAKELYLNRLKKYYSNDLTAEQIDKQFSTKLEKYSEDKIINELQKRYNGKEYRHLIELREKIKEGIGLKAIEDIANLDSNLETLVSDTENNPLEQKYKIYLLYKEWANWGTKKSKVFEDMTKSKVNINVVVDFVNQQYRAFKNGEKTEFDNIKEKYKADLLAQLTHENNIKNTCYSGIDEFINLSWGNPRVFLLILKLIVEKSDLLGERPLDEGSIISLEAQYQGVFETAKWFYQDVEIVGDAGKNLYKSLNSLSNVFQIYRFSDKPTETSVCTFNFGIESISSCAKEYINIAKTHSLIVEVKDRKQRNSGREEMTYQLNRILAPLWNLPSSRRGVADFDTETIDAIFDPKKHKLFESKYKEIKSRFSAPLFGKNKDSEGKKTKRNIKSNNSPTLFTE